MSRPIEITPKLKKKLLKAYSKGASETQLRKYMTRYAIYSSTTPEERKQAKALHDTIIRNIFES